MPLDYCPSCLLNHYSYYVYDLSFGIYLFLKASLHAFGAGVCLENSVTLLSFLQISNIWSNLPHGICIISRPVNFNSDPNSALPALKFTIYSCLLKCQLACSETLQPQPNQTLVSTLHKLLLLFQMSVNVSNQPHPCCLLYLQPPYSLVKLVVNH